MPRNKLFDEEKALDQAMVLFWKKGYHETSITDLIEALGISNASIYHSFKGKRQLFDRAFERYRQRSLAGVQAFIQTQTNVKAGLRLIFQRIIQDDLLDPQGKGCMVVNTTTELLPDDEAMRRVVEQYRADVISTFYAFLQQGVAWGQVSGDKSLITIANLLFTYMMGLRVADKIKPDEASANASLEALLSLLD
ncbi:MAG: TetR/AcrR family transcriptional regulator [Bacteroidota bacterium]